MATIKVKIDDEWIEVPSIGISPMAEAPIDGKTYGRKDGDWSEISTGGTQYLDLSMFSADNGTLSEEDYQKVVTAYNNKIGIASSGQYYGDLYISERSGIYVIIANIPTSEGIDTLSYTVCYISIISSNKSYNLWTKDCKILTGGFGTKALTDNGQYAEFAKPVKLENGGSGSVTKLISPNTFYSFGE